MFFPYLFCTVLHIFVAFFIGFVTMIFNFRRVINYFHEECDASSLAVTRIIVGSLLLIDLVYERGLSKADIIWGDSNECRFPLFDGLVKLSMKGMCAVYALMFFGIIGIIVGFKYRLSCITYTVCYWYLFLLDKSRWNNHSYLFGLLILIFSVSNAHLEWSFDYCIFNKTASDKCVPFWQYFILRSQIFLVYFIAGIKKLDLDWLNGHSMTYLSEHWIFDIFRKFLTNDSIDFIIVHWGGFLYDLLIGFLFVCGKTRTFAFMLSFGFNIMNSRLFSIGMFPYIMIATMPLFCSPNWPKRIAKKLNFLENNYSKTAPKKSNQEFNLNTFKQICWLAFIVLYLCVQIFLPFSHWITKGYNTWTNGLYGYSWDMMVHNWKHIHTRVTVIDESFQKFYIDPQKWTQSSRWSHHSDMVKQFSMCVKKSLMRDYKVKNPAIYIDTWISLNGRFAQRVYDPRVNIIDAEWSPFRKPSWVMPLITNLTNWQQKLKQLEESYSDNNITVVFIADFPGLSLTNYIEPEFANTSLVVLSGWLQIQTGARLTRFMSAGDKMQLKSKQFHKITPIKYGPACYMIVYANQSIHINNNSLPLNYIDYNNHYENIESTKLLPIKNSTINKTINEWIISFKFILNGIMAVIEEINRITSCHNCTKSVLLY